MKISIIGAGSFGTAMAAVAASCGNEVVLWAHDPNVASEIEQTRHNPIYLQSIALDHRVRATSSLAEAAEFSDVLFMIVPSHHYRGVLAQMRPHLRREIAVVSGTKGIENDTLQRMSEVTAIELGGTLRAFAVLSGPTFALETARGDHVHHRHTLDRQVKRGFRRISRPMDVQQNPVGRKTLRAGRMLIAHE